MSRQISHGIISTENSEFPKVQNSLFVHVYIIMYSLNVI